MNSGNFQRHLPANEMQVTNLPNGVLNEEGISDFDYEEIISNSPYLVSIDENFEKYLKRISHARFHQNTKLMLDVFSEFCVPDTRSIVTSQRMNVLEKQVASLTAHQKKLETELDDIEQKFLHKKSLYETLSVDFEGKLKQALAFKPSEELYQQILQRLRNQVVLSQQPQNIINSNVKTGNSVTCSTVMSSQLNENQLNVTLPSSIPPIFTTTNQSSSANLDDKVENLSVVSMTEKSDIVDVVPNHQNENAAESKMKQTINSANQ